MAIDALQNQQQQQLQQTSIATASNKAANTKAAATQNQNANAMQAAMAGRADSVSFTSVAKTLTAATNKARNASGIDQAKVDKIKSAIKDGSYKINYQSVANKLVESESSLNSLFA